VDVYIDKRPMPRKNGVMMLPRKLSISSCLSLYGVSAKDKEVCVMRNNICVRIELVVAGGVR
jgi:hypothetical protein